METGLRLPCGCRVEDIRNAPATRVNIVADPTALPLAREMERRFGTPYVPFWRYAGPERIGQAYRELFRHLGLPLPARVAELHRRAQDACEQARGTLDGIKYIYGNTPFHCFELNRFMVSLGMEPQLIQLNQLSEEDLPDRRPFWKSTTPM